MSYQTTLIFRNMPGIIFNEATKGYCISLMSQRLSNGGIPHSHPYLFLRVVLCLHGSYYSTSDVSNGIQEFK